MGKSLVSDFQSIASELSVVGLESEASCLQDSASIVRFIQFHFVELCSWSAFKDFILGYQKFFERHRIYVNVLPSIRCKTENIFVYCDADPISISVPKGCTLYLVLSGNATCALDASGSTDLVIHVLNTSKFSALLRGGVSFDVFCKDHSVCMMEVQKTCSGVLHALDSSSLVFDGMNSVIVELLDRSTIPPKVNLYESSKLFVWRYDKTHVQYVAHDKTSSVAITDAADLVTDH